MMFSWKREVLKSLKMERPGDCAFRSHLESILGHAGAQDRQEEPQEAPRQPTWRQDGPTWLQDGVPNLFQNHENSIEKMLLFFGCFLIEFWRDLGAKIDEKSNQKSKKT